MINGNVIKFGTGDVLVEVGTRCITLKQFNPEAVGFKTYRDSITIDFDIPDYLEIMDKLESVSNREINSFEFKNYIFEFDFNSIYFIQSTINLHDAIFIAYRCNAKYFSC